jgi:ABC-2 type transport system ATP-binding protein
MQATNWVAGLSGVSKRYGANVALDRVSLGIERGKVTALLGPNGAGKSTTVGLLLGLAKADEGRVELFGQSPQVLAARRRMGVMLQSAGLIETLRVRELVQLTSSYYSRPRTLTEVADMAGIGGLLGKPYGALSGGQQRRVQFALAICGRPELLFLDEPTTGLDIEARESLWAVVRGLVADGCAVLLTTHYLEEAEALAHRVAVLMRGRIVAEGTVDEIRAMGVRRRIRCVSALEAAEVRAWPGVEAVTVDEASRGAGAASLGAKERGALAAQGLDTTDDASRARGGAAAGTLGGETRGGVDVGGAHVGDVAPVAAVGAGGQKARERRRLEISAVVAEPIVRRLLEGDPGLSELEVARAGLAEAFVQITKGPMHASDGLAGERQPRFDTERAGLAQGEAA